MKFIKMPEIDGRKVLHLTRRDLLPDYRQVPLAIIGINHLCCPNECGDYDLVLLDVHPLLFVVKDNQGECGVVENDITKWLQDHTAELATLS